MSFLSKNSLVINVCSIFFFAVNIAVLPVVLAAWAHACFFAFQVPAVSRRPRHDIDDRIVGLAVFALYPPESTSISWMAEVLVHDKAGLGEIIPHVNAINHIGCV